VHPTGRPCAVRLDEGGPAQKTLKDNDVRLSAVSHMTTMARDHYYHHGAPQAGAHSAEAIRLCAEGKQE